MEEIAQREDQQIDTKIIDYTKDWKGFKQVSCTHFFPNKTIFFMGVNAKTLKSSNTYPVNVINRTWNFLHLFLERKRLEKIKSKWIRAIQNLN